jgi:3-oxoacyl-[acyl-carrier protein] reductase
MDLHLIGKRALVTGSSSGIGEGIARVLAAEGAAVIVHGRNADRAKLVAQQIVADGGNAMVVTGDLSTDSGAASVMKAVNKLVGGIDILVNNAGFPEHKGWFELTSDDWLHLYNNNVVSMVRMIRQVVPQMKKERWGRIIQISSVVATQPFATMPHHGAAKAAILNLTLSLARELAETGITVNTVSPGVILTPGSERYFQEKARQANWGDDWANIEKQILRTVLYNPTGHVGKVDDVANLVAFLSSPVSGYINGANYRVDGGSTGTAG